MNLFMYWINDSGGKCQLDAPQRYFLNDCDKIPCVLTLSDAFSVNKLYDVIIFCKDVMCFAVKSNICAYIFIIT